MLGRDGALAYGEIRIPTVMLDGAPWIAVKHLTGALGLDGNSIRKIILYDPGAFGPGETRLEKLVTPTGLQRKRLVSIRGLMLLAARARSAEGRRFRVWLWNEVEDDILESIAAQLQADVAPTPPGTFELLGEAAPIVRLTSWDAAVTMARRRAGIGRGPGAERVRADPVRPLRPRPHEAVDP